MLQIADHPLLEAGVFQTVFPAGFLARESPSWLLEGLALDARAPLARTEEVRRKVRDLLRHGGYKPTGRGKPASEYLVRAATQGVLAGINPAVDACNVVSLHSGLPISVIDQDKASPPFRIDVAPAEAAYVFNPAGQEIRLAGLLCLFDAQGPCACGVKDSQRTKTEGGTTRTLSVVWGTRELPGRTEEAVGWYRDILEKLGAATREFS